MKKKILEIVDSATAQLQIICSSIETARQEAWWMVEEITKKSEAELLREDEIDFSPNQEELLNSWIKKRTIDSEPLQYILGYVPFCDLKINVRHPILIPRPETEEWTSWIVDSISENLGQNSKLNILDLCCGSGCIALALANRFTNSYVLGCDILDDAVNLSIENKKLNKIKNVDFIKSDLFKNLNDRHNFFDLIVSNPPYISSSEFENLSDEVKKWEDKNALVAPDNGLYFYEKIVKEAPKFLKPRKVESKLPQLVFEIGYTQAAYICNLLAANEYYNIKVHKDLEGKDRWISSNISY